jgi:hypothetical protein
MPFDPQFSDSIITIICHTQPPLREKPGDVFYMEDVI